MRYILISVLFTLLSHDNNEKLVGRWESPVSPKGNTTGVVFNADGSFEGYVNRKPFTSGTYTLKNDTFSLVDNGCDGRRGVYRTIFFSHEDSIRFQPIEDSCEERKNGIGRMILGRKK